MKLLIFVIFPLTVTLICFYKAFSLRIYLKDLKWLKWKAVLLTDRNVKFYGIDWFIIGVVCTIAHIYLIYKFFDFYISIF